MKKTMLVALLGAVAMGGVVIGTGRARAQVMPDLPREKVGVCQIPKAWGTVKAITLAQDMTGRARQTFVLENEAGEIRLVDGGRSPVLTIGRE
jgi:hypothetical protein